MLFIFDKKSLNFVSCIMQMKLATPRNQLPIIFGVVS